LASARDQSRVSGLVIGEPATGAVVHAMSLKALFRDINTDGSLHHLFRASACHSGLSPGYPFRPKEKTRAIKL
jgi:hypothetical protein